MQVPLQITFRRMEPSAAVEADIRDNVDKLELFDPNIISCRVVVEATEQRHHKGNLYRAGIDVRVPGAEIVASRHADEHHAHEDIYVAVRDAFDAARRQLEDHARKHRNKVKHHDVPAHGKIVELVPAEHYGRIETPDGRSIYFNENSLVNVAFSDIQEGSKVRFAEEMGDEGPQASSVVLEGKHHVAG